MNDIPKSTSLAAWRLRPGYPIEMRLVGWSIMAAVLAIVVLVAWWP